MLGGFPISRSTRRRFTQQSVALGLGLTAGLSGRAFAINDKISIACIGVRGRGNSLMNSFAAAPDCAITRICDVNESTRRRRGAEMKEKTGLMPKLVKQGNSNSGQTQQAHIRNFLDAVRSRNRKSLNQEIYSGHVSTVMYRAGNISWRTGKKLRFDANTETFDEKEANQYVGRKHHKGFELPKIV